MGIPFIQVGWYLFILSSIVYFVVSLMTPAPAPEKTEGLTWTHPLDAIKGKLQGGITDPRVMATILFITMVVLYYFLR